MTNNKIQSAMNIILHAGDARAACMDALDAIEKSDFSTAEANIKTAIEEITKAHKIQTDEIQGEAAGEVESEYNLLFSHAQDTLMTIMSEINIAKKMIKIYRNFDERLSKLENNKYV